MCITHTHQVHKHRCAQGYINTHIDTASKWKISRELSTHPKLWVLTNSDNLKWSKTAQWQLIRYWWVELVWNYFRLTSICIKREVSYANIPLWLVPPSFSLEHLFSTSTTFSCTSVSVAMFPFSDSWFVFLCQFYFVLHLAVLNTVYVSVIFNLYQFVTCPVHCAVTCRCIAYFLYNKQKLKW